MSVSFSEWIDAQEEKEVREFCEFVEQAFRLVWPLICGDHKRFITEAAKGYDGPDPCRDALGGSGKLPQELASQIHRSAQIVRANAMLDAGKTPQDAGVDITPEEARAEKAAAWSHLEETLYPLILRFACRMGRNQDLATKDPQIAQEVAQETWMAIQRKLISGVTKEGKVKWSRFPKSFVGYVAGAAKNRFPTWIKKKSRALSPQSFINKGEEGGKGFGTNPTFGGGDPGRIGSYAGGQRRGGKGVGGDENAQAAQALQQAVGGGAADTGNISGGDFSMPGGSPRYEIPGMSVARDFNYDLLHQALNALSKEGKMQPKYMLKDGALAALAWKAKFGLMADVAGTMADTKGISMGNLNAKDDIMRQYGKMAKDPRTGKPRVRGFGQKPDWTIDDEQLKKLGIEPTGRKKFSEFDAIAFQMEPTINRHIWQINLEPDDEMPDGVDYSPQEWEDMKAEAEAYREKHGISIYDSQGNYTPIPYPDRPTRDELRRWMGRSKQYLMNYVLPKDARSQNTYAQGFQLPDDLSRPGAEEDVDGIDYRPIDQRLAQEEPEKKLKGGLEA